MNAENFSNYIKNASQLYQLSYQELKSLVIQYPYCQNLRYLLLKKSRLENHKDFEHNLHLAAAYSIDRDFLYQQLKKESIRKEVEENYLLTEDYLEVKDLSAVEESPDQRPYDSSNEDNLEEQPLENFVIELDDMPNLEEKQHLSEEEDLPQEEDVADLSILENLAAAEETELGVSIAAESTDTQEDLTPKAKQIPQPSSGKITNLDDLIEKDKEADRAKGSDSIDDLVINSVLSGMEEAQTEIAQESPISKREVADIPLDLVENISAFAALLETFELPKEVSGFSVSPRDKDGPQEVADEEVVPSELEDDFPKPEPKEAFSSWVEQFQSPKPRLHFGEIGASLIKDKKKKRKKKKKEKKREIAKSVAKQSIVENEEIASEPLAALLESQGHYGKAIAMYERLCLLFPEKSIFFAAKIEQLKEL